MKVVYLKHPVSQEDKAKHKAKGEKIIDAAFEPESAKVKKPKAKPKED